MPTSHSNVQIERLNLAINDILDPVKSQAFSFSAYVKNRIRQYKLTNHLEFDEVVNEAYKRAVQAVEKGKVIDNWRAWLKATCLNIIREKSRDRKRQNPTAPDSPVIVNKPCNQSDEPNETPEAEAGEKEAQKRLTWLYQAIEEYAKCDPDSAQLLQLKLFSDWKWSQVREHLLDQGKTDVPSLETMRKRASRAKTKIRSIYHRIEKEYVEAKVSR